MADALPPPRMGPGRRAVYRPDNSQATGFGGFIRSDDVRDAVATVAEDIRAGAAAGSARGDDTPHMADQWKVNKDAGFIKVSGNVRVKVEIFNPDIAAAAQEFGYRGHDRKHTLRRVAGVYGDFKEHGS